MTSNYVFTTGTSNAQARVCQLAPATTDAAARHMLFFATAELLYDYNSVTLRI